ncbi:MAG TPA: EAL domain-containing protein, partial [Pseudolabrys sp.]|nr:EAL domain-containing protein [Pseudolabrys sp.]
MRAFTRRNIAAVVAAVLLVGAPLVAFGSWLDHFIDQQARAEIAMAASRGVALVENRIEQADAALEVVSKQNLQWCSPAAEAAMRQAAFDAAPVKDVMLLGPDLKMLCSGNGLPEGGLRVLSTMTLSGKSDLSLDIMRTTNGTRMLRLYRTDEAGPNRVAVLMPAKLLMPQAVVAGATATPYIELADTRGHLIESVGTEDAVSAPHVVASAKSKRFGFVVEMVVPRVMIPAEHAGVRWLAMSAILAVLVLLAAVVLLVRRRVRENPVLQLKRALKAGEFVPYYQPIVDIRSGQLRGAEVLVRWRKPDGSLVLPGSFIPLAESSGLIRAMTEDLMRRVCAEAGEAIGRRPGLKISFNFAGYLFGDPSIVKDVRNVFAGGPIAFSQVVLEVTERDPIENFTETRRTIAALQELGVRIAIDDVGTGHSGLSYMLKLGVDIIKIDKMFVDAVGTDQNATTIVEMLVDLARNMRMDVVAEGVENFEQVVYLRDRGIRQAQGYVFAPPLPGSSFLQLVEAVHPLNRAAGEGGSEPHSAGLEHAEVAA